MASKKLKVASAALSVMLAAGGYLAYSLFAAQARGALAQAPLNVTTQTPPAFIMAVDDSNSMMFESMYGGSDGRLRWVNNSFFSSAGVFADNASGCDGVWDTWRGGWVYPTDCYLHLYPHAGYRDAYTPAVAMPPLSQFGFSRSPNYNASYFNPSVTYEPWTLASPDASGNVRWPQANIRTVRADPRPSFTTAYGVTYDMTAERRVGTELFQFQAGMVIPAGTFYRTEGTARACNSTTSNGVAGTNRAWQQLAGNATVGAGCTLAVGYFPATFYLPAAQAAPAGYRTGDVYRPVINNACGPGCNLRKYEIRPDNYSSTTAYNAAIQNFANWFQYHRNRLLAMVGSSSEAMSTVTNMRVGYFTINNRSNVTMYSMPTERPQLYQQIYALAPNGGTPNRSAVAHLGSQFRRTDAGAPVQLSCQRNGGMLFTDGYTNNTDNVTGFGNADSGGTFFQGAPFQDGYSNTIADIAARYYSGTGFTPLRTGADFPAGQVPIPKACSSLDPASAEWKRLDCQPDLHMNFYGITLGAKGFVYGNNAAATDDPYSNPPNWNNGDPTTVGDGRVIDEIWHAAINSRGDFINAATPADVTAAMRRVLQSVGGAASPSGSLARSGARIGVGSLAITPSYRVDNESTDWSGMLTASRLSINDANRTVTTTQFWEASSQIPAPGGRKVFFDGGGTVRELTAGNITLAGLCSGRTDMSLCTESLLASLGVNTVTAVNYLKGDATQEVRNGGRLRDRTTVLGDIVNSTPVISSPVDDFGYRALAGGLGESYATYLASKKASGRYTVFVGANDGMLHAFDGGMDAAGNDAGNGGRELFGYVPGTAYGHLGNLLLPYDSSRGLNQLFSHRYYVDGPVTVGDSYYGGAWHTSLVGTAGAGGRSVFALDVSNPGAFDADSRLWEINDVNASLPEAVRNNIGHVLGKPVIVPVATAGGQVSWKAIFGNGYNSASGKAVLFVVDIATGTPQVRMIEAVESGAGVPAGSNGLGNIVVVDRWSGAGLTTAGRDGYADTVYAGDQKGAIWKFDLRSAATQVTVPVFVTASHTEGGATFRQPVTGGLLATAGPSGGVMLLFGTGSFSFANDVSDSTIQALYGVADTAPGAVSSTLTAANLQRYAVVTSAGKRSLQASAAPVGSRGWYVALPARERFVGYPSIASGTVFMATYSPNVGSAGCDTTGLNWLFGLNARTGAAAMGNIRFGSPTGTTAGQGTAAVSLQTDGTAPVKDVAVSVVPRLQPPALTPGVPNPPVPPAAGCWMVISVAGAESMYVPYPCGRQSWRQIQ